MIASLERTCLLIALAFAAHAADASALATVFQNGPAFIVDSESLATGYASAELGAGGSAGVGSYSYVGSAYADTARGARGVAASANGAGYEFESDRLTVTSRSEFSDFLRFSTSGTVTVRLAVQGSFASVFGGQMSSFAKFGVIASSETAQTFWRGGATTMTVNTTETVIAALPSNYLVSLESTLDVTAAVPIPVSGRLDVLVTPPVTGDARALFDHTAQMTCSCRPACVSRPTAAISSLTRTATAPQFQHQPCCRPLCSRSRS